VLMPSIAEFANPVRIYAGSTLLPRHQLLHRGVV